MRSQTARQFYAFAPDGFTGNRKRALSFCTLHRRAEKAFLAEWDRTRVKRRPRHIGLDEIQRGKGQRFWTVLSDVVHGEVIGLRQDRSEATATALLAEDLTGRERAAITAVCTDMHRPYLNAVGAVLATASGHDGIPRGSVLIRSPVVRRQAL